MTLWIKNIGSPSGLISNRWYDEGSVEGEFRWHVRFSRDYNGKRIEKGDFLLYLAFVKDVKDRHVCGVARVSSDYDQTIEDPRPPDDQWPLKRAVTPLLVVPLATQGPTLEEIGAGSPNEGGYKEVTPEAFAKAIRLLARNASPEALHTLLPPDLAGSTSSQQSQVTTGLLALAVEVCAGETK